MTNSTFKLLLLEGAQPLSEKSHYPEYDCIAYDEDLMMMVDTRTRVPIHRIQTAKTADTKITKIDRETTDDE